LESIAENKIHIQGEEFHHLKNVLRLKRGSKITVFDGKGKEYSGRIIELDKNEAVVDIESSRFVLSKDSPYKVTLAQVISKNQKIDFVVQKAAELGVDKIIPVSSLRAVVKLDAELSIAKKNRWQRIAKEASKQCGRLTVPEVGDCLNIKEAVAYLKDYDLKLFFCINKETIKLKKVLERFVGKPPETIALFIGPEGDFTQDEIDLAKDNGCDLVSLGERVLRTETAGLYVLSILDYIFN